MDFFHWCEDGELRTTSEGPADRTGTTPDALNALMGKVCLNPSGDTAPDFESITLDITDAHGGRSAQEQRWPRSWTSPTGRNEGRWGCPTW